MDQSPPPFETMVFVCTHQRASGERVACANSGRDGLELLEGLRKFVQEKGLTGKVRICKSGCMDRCVEGPNLMVIPSQGPPIWIKNAAKDNIETICSMLIKNK